MLTRSDALPYVHALALDVPDGALGVHGPIYVGFPYARSVAHEARHSAKGVVFVTEKIARRIRSDDGREVAEDGLKVFIGRKTRSSDARDWVVDGEKEKVGFGLQRSVRAGAESKQWRGYKYIWRT